MCANKHFSLKDAGKGDSHPKKGPVGGEQQGVIRAAFLCLYTGQLDITCHLQVIDGRQVLEAVAVF